MASKKVAAAAPRKPAAPPAEPPPKAADSFVFGAAQTSGRSLVRAARRGAAKGEQPRAVVQREDGRELRRMTIYLPVQLAKRLMVHAAETDAEMSAVVAEALERYFG